MPFTQEDSVEKTGVVIKKIIELSQTQPLKAVSLHHIFYNLSTDD